jgi:tetratricopeptide (TPR) repeat protein
LEIRKRLAQKNPLRFESDYARSLNNYANRLSDTGQNEKALEHAREALEIRKRLVQKNPDRFEPDYAKSLSNYANHLSDAGQNEKALEHACKALEICKRLAEKNPDRFADNLFSSICIAQFLAWLCDQSDGSDKSDLNQLMTYKPSHRQSLMLLLSAFVEGCSAADQTTRNDTFRRVSSLWSGLSMVDKNRGKPYWLCAAAWCATFEPPAADTEWEASWQQYVKQRNGHIPRWMLDVAQRLEFQWPR